MRFRSRFVAASLALALCSTASAALAAVARFPATSSATVGGLRLTSESDDDATLTGVQIFVSAGLERQTRATNGAAALTAECIVRTPVKAPDGTTAPLVDAISAHGGSLSYTIDESTVHYYLESRPKSMPELLGTLAKALAAPDFSPETVALARKSLGSRVEEGEKNPFRVGVQMFKESFLQSGLAYPDYGTASSLAALGTSDLRAFYARTYRRGGVSASAIGKITPEITAAIAALGAALPDGNVSPLNPASRPLPANPPVVRAHRDVNRPFIIVGFNAPTPAQQDFGAMLILETLLSNAFERSSATTLSLGERSVGALYLYDSAPASLVVYVNGGTGIDPDVALREIVLVAKSLASKPLTGTTLKRFKATAEGEFVTSTTALSDRSYLIGTLSAAGLGDRSVNGALDAIERATGADVQRAAKKYLQRFIVAIVAPRQERSDQ